MTKKILEYTENQIASLTPVESLRYRPTVFIGETGTAGVMHLLKETVTNSIDEFIGGFGKTILIEIDAQDTNAPKFKITDEGRGIPLQKLVDSVSVMNTSGKYGDISGKGGQGYGVSAGLNGLGSKCVNFLSRNFTATSIRDGEQWTVKFDKGKQVGDVKKIKSDKPSGTIIEYTPDVEPLGDVNISGSRNDYYTYLEIMSYVNPGVEIIFKWNNEKPVKFFHQNGVVDYFDKLCYDRKIHIIGQSNHIQYKNEDGSAAYDIVYAIADRNGGSTISYINGINTSDGGVHVGTLYEAMGVLTTALNKGNYIQKNIANKVKITGSEIRDSLFAVIIADKVSPKFDTQIKSRFVSEDYKPLVINQMKIQISEWISKNQSTIDKIGSHLALLAKIKYENTLNKEKILKAGGSKNDLFKTIDIKKFVDCNKNDPERSELFLCEGDSAASSVKAGRDRDYQAVFALRGKVKNIIKSDDLSEELMTMVKILGIGWGDDINLNRLRYRRIIILTDADDDGMHISSLLIAFFFRYYPQLIINGNIFIAKPPLYTLKSKKHTIFINNHEQLNSLFSEKSIRVYDVIDKNGNVLPKGVAKYYMKSLPAFSDMLDGMSKRLMIDPLLLEALTMSFKDVMKGDCKNLSKYGFEIHSYKKSKNGVREININKGYEHFFVKIDADFVNKIIKPISDYIVNNIKIARLRLVGRGTGTIYSGFFYVQGKLIFNTLFGGASQMEVKRSKGLGSMTADELRTSAMHPSTRYIIQLKITDEKKTSFWIEKLFTNSVEKKEMFTSPIDEIQDLEE